MKVFKQNAQLALDANAYEAAKNGLVLCTTPERAVEYLMECESDEGQVDDALEHTIADMFIEPEHKAELDNEGADAWIEMLEG